MVSQKTVSCRVSLEKEGGKKKDVRDAKVYRSQIAPG